MRNFLWILLFFTTQASAQAPQTLVAQTGWPHPHQITLLSEPCGWPGGALRAQRVLPGRTIVWGCWGYNPTGVQIQWQDDSQQWIHYFELWFWDEAGRFQQLGYQTLHLRLWLLRNTAG